MTLDGPIYPSGAHVSPQTHTLLIDTLIIFDAYTAADVVGKKNLPMSDFVKECAEVWNLYS